jgi:hypothetical protein
MPEPAEHRPEDQPARGRAPGVSAIAAGRPVGETYRFEVRLTDYEPGVPGVTARWVPGPPPEQVRDRVFELLSADECGEPCVLPLAPPREPESSWSPPPPRKPPPPGQRPFTGFDRERSEYERRKPGLLKMFEGQFVVLVGEELAGPADTFEEAIGEGYRKFGLGPLYIKQVLEVDPVAEVTRAVTPCRS